MSGVRDYVKLLRELRQEKAVDSAPDDRVLIVDGL